jgi:hypothetical protein
VCVVKVLNEVRDPHRPVGRQRCTQPVRGHQCVCGLRRKGEGGLHSLYRLWAYPLHICGQQSQTRRLRP